MDAEPYGRRSVVTIGPTRTYKTCARWGVLANFAVAERHHAACRVGCVGKRGLVDVIGATATGQALRLRPGAEKWMLRP
jgi:hypothetical protein